MTVLTGGRVEAVTLSDPRNTSAAGIYHSAIPNFHIEVLNVSRANPLRLPDGGHAGEGKVVMVSVGDLGEHNAKCQSCSNQCEKKTSQDKSTFRTDGEHFGFCRRRLL